MSSKGSSSVKSDRRVITQEIPLSDLSHEVCVAVTQASYWGKLIGKNNSITISVSGMYIPKELLKLCNYQRLALTVRGYDDDGLLKAICRIIQYDLVKYEKVDEPQLNTDKSVSVFGSLYNSLEKQFNTEIQMFGQKRCYINEIERNLRCNINVVPLGSEKSPFSRVQVTIQHESLDVIDLAIFRIQKLVLRAQNDYASEFAAYIGRHRKSDLVRPVPILPVPFFPPLTTQHSDFKSLAVNSSSSYPLITATQTNITSVPGVSTLPNNGSSYHRKSTHRNDISSRCSSLSPNSARRERASDQKRSRSRSVRVKDDDLQIGDLSTTYSGSKKRKSMKSDSDSEDVKTIKAGDRERVACTVDTPDSDATDDESVQR
ncbi:unnamed protein product, partial [Didymodactylos carnosus]